MRQIPDDIPRDIVRQMDTRLRQIETQHDVVIPLAVESGSRAWDFASPDSDYDCRFLFIRRLDHYLSLTPERDVIELPIDGVFDVNGWDLAKALKLLLKGNVIVLEWLRSPIIYGGSEQLRTELLDFAQRHMNRDLVLHHYLYLGRHQRHAYFRDGREIALKKLFYALRPATALRWLRHHPQDSVPPTHFPTLLAQAAPPAAIVDLTADLLERKAKTHELGSAPLPDTICAYVDSEFQLAADMLGPKRLRLSAQAQAQANALFCRWVRDCDRAAG